MSTSSFFLRVSSLPVVEGSYNLAASILSYVKEKNEYAKSAISTTENTLSSLKSTTKKYVGPVQNKLQPQLHFVDEKATKGLDYVEGKLPIIAKPPGEIFQATCSAVSTGAHKLMELKIVNQITNSALNAACSLKDRLAPHVIDYFLADLQQRGVKVNGEHALTVEHFIVNALPIVKSILMAVQQSVGDCATEGKARIVEIVDDEISAHENANANKQGGEVLQN